MQRLSIGKLAKAANVGIDTIRFYEKSGLLPRAARRPSGYREYSDVDLLQLQFIRRARAAGFSLEEIAELLTLGDEAGTTEISGVIECKLEIVDRKVAELEHWRRALHTLARTPPEPFSRRSFLELFAADAATDSGAQRAGAPIPATITERT